MSFVKNCYLLEILELLVSGQSLLLSHAAVDGNRGKVLLDEKLGQGNTPLDRLDEDDHLQQFMLLKTRERKPEKKPGFQVALALSDHLLFRKTSQSPG